MKGLAVEALIDSDLVTRSVRVLPREVVFVKAIFEASEGLGAVFAERGGDLVVFAPRSREAELDEVLTELAQEIDLVIEDPARDTV